MNTKRGLLGYYNYTVILTYIGLLTALLGVTRMLDGDARGGAALSIRSATGKPIKFVGTGEKLDMIELFHPDRMASRILGMGDMLTLIEKAQQSFDEKKALDDLSLDVKKGDFITLIGANGAGKSTLFGAIAGSFITDSGSITLDNEDITLKPEFKRARYIGRLFQDPMRGSAPGMTVEENLSLAAGRGGWMSFVSKADKKLFRERVAMLEMALEDRMNQPVGLLSGGQRQALTLMMATLSKPKLLLLDEHTAALDPKTAARVLSITDRLVAQYGLTTLMITHNMRDAIQYGTRLIMLHQGKILIDIAGQEKKNLSVEDLLELFEKASGSEFANDRAVLA